MKVAIYSRKSVNTGKGESIENQIEMGRQYIFANIDGVSESDIVVFKDEGFSAKNTDRPQFQKMLREIRQETLYRISRLGISIVDGEAVFNTGGGAIRPPPESENRPDIIVEPSKYRLDIDPNLSEAEAVEEMMNLVRLSPDAGRVMLAHSLLYTMRKAYEAAWKSSCCILFLYGYTGTKKTTLSAFMTQLHNRSQGIEDPPHLNASVPAAEAIIYKKSDCVIVPDDLFPVRFRDMKVQQMSGKTACCINILQLFHQMVYQKFRHDSGTAGAVVG